MLVAISLPEILRGDRLVLRRWDQRHIDALVEAIGLSLEHLRPWMPWAQEVPTYESARSAIELGRQRFDAGQDIEYFLFEIGTGQIVGAVALHVKDGDTAEIGYWVRSDRHRRGYGTEATQIVVEAAFEYLPQVAAIEIRMDKANVASAGVAAKAGFVLSGDEERDCLTPSHTGRGWIWRLDRAGWQGEDPR